MKRITTLKLALRGAGLKNSELDRLFHEIEKVGTVKGFESLGFGEPGSKILNGIVGDDWGFVVGKWMKDWFENPDGSLPSWMRIDNSPRHLSRVLNALEKLEGLDESGRSRMLEDRSEDSELLKKYFLKENDYDISKLLKVESDSDRFIRALKGDEGIV